MRIIYNTTFIIPENIEKEWVEFIRANYLAVLTADRLCQDILFSKVSIDQPDGKTYSLQLVFDSEEKQNHFLENWLPRLEDKIIRRYADRYLCFSSTLTEI